VSNTKKQSYSLYTDGGCKRPGSVGAWAFVLVDNETQQEQRVCKGSYTTTNNRMELLAVIRGLQSIPDNSEVALVSDSEYVVKGIQEWMPGWKRRGWKRAVGPVINLDLWKQIDQQTQRLTVTPIWVKGHSNHKYNEICDQLASHKIEELLERINEREGKNRERSDVQS